MRILTSGECEPVKAAVHGVALGLCVVMAAYNLCAFASRRERHLAVNVVLYGAAVWWEVKQVRCHVTKE